MALRPLRITAGVAALSCALLAGPAAGNAFACENSGARPGQASQPQLEAAAICLVNDVRARHGLRRLHANGRLAAAASAHSSDMVQKRYFGHVSRSGKSVVDRLNRSGYIAGASSWSVGENIAWGSGSRSTPRSIVSAWMHSSGHRANILSRRFHEIGMGVTFDTPRGSYSTGATYTNTFGARKGGSSAARTTRASSLAMRLASAIKKPATASFAQQR